MRKTQLYYTSRDTRPMSAAMQWLREWLLEAAVPPAQA
ncbi:hypothetical protein D8I24_3231 (plasmid) [Cupriavidus necator H850]|nr:hypothetical protein D8I24_3231 [Cupriavidus necator H850]